MDNTEAKHSSTSVGVNGSGCPPGSVYYLINSQWIPAIECIAMKLIYLWFLLGDNTAVTVTFSQYWAEAGPSLPVSANRKNCQLTLGVKCVLDFGSTSGILSWRLIWCFLTGSRLASTLELPTSIMWVASLRDSGRMIFWWFDDSIAWILPAWW